jgi:hypothetical protein
MLDIYPEWLYNHSMMTQYAHTPRKTLQYGNETWFLPFKAGSAYVTDARGKNFAECNSIAIAKELTKMMNELGDAQPPIKQV